MAQWTADKIIVDDTNLVEGNNLWFWGYDDCNRIILEGVEPLSAWDLDGRVAVLEWTVVDLQDQIDDFATGFPVGSTTVTGAFREADLAQTIAGTASEDGARLVVNPENLDNAVINFVQNKSEIQDVIEAKSKWWIIEVTAWENITAGDGLGAVFFGKWIVNTTLTIQSTVGTSLNIGDAAASQRRWLTFTTPASKSNIARTLYLKLTSAWTPIDNVEFRLFASDKTTPVVWFTMQSVVGSWLIPTYTWQTFLTLVNLQDVTLSPSTAYFLEIRRSGSNSGTDYYKVIWAGSDVLANHGSSVYDSWWAGTWTNSNNDLYFQLQYWNSFTNGYAYLTDTSFPTTSQADWVAVENGTVGNPIRIQVSWELSQTTITQNRYWLNGTGGQWTTTMPTTGRPFLMWNGIEWPSLLLETQIQKSYHSQSLTIITQSTNTKMYLDSFRSATWTTPVKAKEFFIWPDIAGSVRIDMTIYKTWIWAGSATVTLYMNWVASTLTASNAVDSSAGSWTIITGIRPGDILSLYINWAAATTAWLDNVRISYDISTKYENNTVLQD